MFEPPPPPPPGAAPLAGIPTTRSIEHNLNHNRRASFNYIVKSIQYCLCNVMIGNQRLREYPVQRLGPELFSQFRVIKMFQHAFIQTVSMV